MSYVVRFFAGVDFLAPVDFFVPVDFAALAGVDFAALAGEDFAALVAFFLGAGSFERFSASISLACSIVMPSMV